ncbi:MAG: hypothetical protein GX275_11515 [Clostridiales bacterium]|nr:hypothetical protein [Clostridiales bacterium]
MRKNIIKILSFLLCWFILICANNVAFAEEDKAIFSFEKDGFWKPTDSVSRDFVIENIWGEEGYLDYLSFQNTYIKDIETKYEYTVDEATNLGILDGYLVEINLINDDNSENLIFSGSMKDFTEGKIFIDNKIYMKLDSKIKFNMTITFDNNAPNKYQNKSYEYIFKPSAYKLVISEEEENILEKEKGDNTNLISTFFKTGDIDIVLFLVTVILSAFTIIILIKSNKKNISKELIL